MSQCKKCVRFHPKAIGNCKLANAWMYLEGMYKFKLSVSDCPVFLEPKKVFAEPKKKDKKEKAPEKTGNKKIDAEEYAKEWNL